jgi:phosphopantothenoylcysteine synthetase/decarboxylase
MTARAGRGWPARPSVWGLHERPRRRQHTGPDRRVCCIINIFTGRTGASIALEAHRRGHAVTLVTSHAEAVAELSGGAPPGPERWSLVRYRTFEDLQDRMASAISPGRLDAVIHCAAVSDYLSAGVYAPAEGTRFDASSGRWVGDSPGMVDRLAGKVKSDEQELWVRMVRAPKLIDRIRTDWSFRGVRSSLEVGLTRALLDVADRSKRTRRGFDGGQHAG